MMISHTTRPTRLVKPHAPNTHHRLAGIAEAAHRRKLARRAAAGEEAVRAAAAAHVAGLRAAAAAEAAALEGLRRGLAVWVRGQVRVGACAWVRARCWRVVVARS